MFLKKVHKLDNATRQNLTKLADDELLQSLTKDNYGDIVNEIFNRYSHILYGVCYKYLKNTEESKDAVQSIFEKIFIDLSNHTVKNLKSWLFVVAKNYCLMHIRKRQLDLKELTPESTTNVLYKLYQEELGQKIDDEVAEDQISKMLALMEKLSSQQGICLSLMYLEDKSYKEIADITGFGMNEVKSHIQNGKRNLRKLLTDGYEQ
ncbi:RNA polymerase sigma factor [Alistipes sp. ZOR0009]|uniref:RNA polymerase sigma factor n=1 Tax=Alistipes sp. ZOR0009 TaxID=1339253 RepID=UPI00068C711D|nr:RNA polymerase sigma factor [Alistipes sp. ZOR0009]